jgi:hypothetical protein
MVKDAQVGVLRRRRMARHDSSRYGGGVDSHELHLRLYPFAQMYR